MYSSEEIVIDRATQAGEWGAALPGAVAPAMHRQNLIARIRASLENPALIGRDGYRKRYLKVQWWVVFWRIVILLQIPEVMLAQPELLSSLRRAGVILALGAGYTAFYAWLATRTRAAGKGYLHALDLAACAALMLLALDPKLIFIMSFYSYSCLLSRPTTKLRIAVPITVILSVAYLAAEARAGLMPPELFTRLEELGNFILYYFWGFGFIGFSAVLERASSLELDALIEEQRHSYRRRLHDDLGNTLCGLHFKIQSLRSRCNRQELMRSLVFLKLGYQRANQVLSNLLGGIDDAEPRDLDGALARLKDIIEDEMGIEVSLSIPGGAKLSPELQREALAVVREAATNAARHGGTDRVSIEVRKHRGKLRFTVADQGRGFDRHKLKAREDRGSMGIKGMRERARLMRARLDIGSGASGTTVALTIDTRGDPGFIDRWLGSDPQQSGGGLYYFLVRLRLFMLGWTLVQALLLPAVRELDIMFFVVSGCLVADSLVYVLFRRPAFRVLARRPWLLVFEQLFFAALIYLSLTSGLPFYFPLYIGVAVIMNGIFLGLVGNTLMTLLLNAGIYTAYFLAPAASTVLEPWQRLEESMQHTTIFVILAFSSGLASEFVESLESLQLKAVNRALLRQREQMTAETHRQLDLHVRNLGAELVNLSRQADREEPLQESLLHKLEKSSTDLKTRLRSILRSLDEPPPESTTTLKGSI